MSSDDLSIGYHGWVGLRKVPFDMFKQYVLIHID